MSGVKPADLVPDDALPPAPHPLPPPWPGRPVEIDGYLTYVRDTPGTSSDAEPALYVHGLGGSAQNWTDLAGLVSDRLAGQAMDLPGFGRSDPAPRGGYSQPAYAARVARVIEHAGRGPVHLFGNSLGGAVTARVAATRPDLVRTLTLISPAMPFIQPRSAHARMLPVLMIPRARRAVAERLRGIPPEQIARGILSICFADLSRLPAQRMAEAVAEATARQEVDWAADAYVHALRGLAGSFLVPHPWSLWGLAARITAPTLVVWGTHDQLVNPQLAPRTAQTIPDSRLLLLEGVGHTAQLEVPRTLARAVLAFLAEADVRADA
jgi:pimeloyl-ACP methyl ester carboxylesterase